LKRKVAVGILIFLTPYLVSAGVVINEIAWMGSVPSRGETFSKADNDESISPFTFVSKVEVHHDQPHRIENTHPVILTHPRLPETW
jgi:hypothetical protein